MLSDVRGNLWVVVAEGGAVDPLGLAVALERRVQVAPFLERTADVVDPHGHAGVVITEGGAVNPLGFPVTLERPVQVALGLKDAADVIEGPGDIWVVVAESGAATQGVLMSVYRTLKLRGLNPTKTIADALRTYLMTDRLPVLPDGATVTVPDQHNPLRPHAASPRSA